MRLPVAIFLFLLCSCHNGERHHAVPRPYAWPRLTLYPDCLVEHSYLPARWMANREAEVSVVRNEKNSVWADVRYPAYGATLHMSFLSHESDDTDRLLANRRERMAVNLGDCPALKEEIVSDNGEFRAELITATGVSPSPLQFIALGEGLMVSGTMFFDRPPTSYDSIRPVTDGLHNELIRALQALSR